MTILGSAAATPAYGRFTSCQVINIQDAWYMIDCGEGAQMRLTDFHVPRNKINHLFISHLHGDHIFGVVGLLTSYSLAGRKEPFHIFSPDGLEEIIEVTLRNSYSQLSFETVFHTFNPEAQTLLYENDFLTVETIPLRHSVPTAGFLFQEKPHLPNFLKEKIEEFNIPISQIPLIKNGADFITSEGTIVPFEELTFPAPEPRKFAYCSDTAYDPAIVDFIRGADLLYHESTFTEQFRANAEYGMHSTALDAARIASAAGVKMLILGHYSARFPDSIPLLDEAKTIFPASYAGYDGVTFSVPFRR